jgi:CDP-glycerol glycerophosphotransferase (TagB/SpsB family)
MYSLRILIRKIKYLVIYILQGILKFFNTKKYVVSESFLGTKKDENIDEVIKQIAGIPVYRVVLKGKKNTQQDIVKYTFNYFWKISRARVVLTNSRLHNSIIHKNKNQTIIQFWHGTPWKKLVFDQSEINFSAQNKSEYLRQFKLDIEKWDHLVVSSEQGEKRLKSAFDYNGSFIRTQYPADIKMIKNNNSEYINALRDKYNLTKDQKVALYMPTFREYEKKDDTYCNIDKINIIQLANEHPEIVFLVRQHYLVKIIDIQADNIIITDSQDLTDLYILSDILITDYSSAIYSFAKLGKPIISYQSDLLEYKKLRGLYSDGVNGMNISVAILREDLKLDQMDDLPRSISNEKSYPHTNQISKIILWSLNNEEKTNYVG